MKNLKLSSEISVSLDLQINGERILFSAIDIERNRFFFASSNNFIYSANIPSPMNAKVQSGLILQSEAQPLDLEAEDKITSFDYLMEKESLIIGTSNGLLLLHMVDSNATEVVGRVEGGVKCISPSPDGDLLAVTTGFGQLLVMTHDWDVLYETTFEDCLEDDVSDSTNSTFSECPISWRGDGKYFATLSNLHNSSFLRKIKVWERDTGVLHSSSEPLSLNPNALEWMPSGPKIATVYNGTNEKCPSIAFFEKNGLERSSFSINEPLNASLEVLKWNCNSDLLASVVRCEGYYCVKIWSFSNNHWYLKQEIRYSLNEKVHLMWDPTKPLQLICWTSSGEISVYNFIWVTAVMDNSVALVIDGSNVFVTPLSLSLIPPPMFSFKLKFPTSVREITFYCGNLKNQLAAFLSDGRLCIIELPFLSFWEDLDGKEFVVEAASYSEIVFGSLLHLQWLDAHILVGASHFGFNHKKLLSKTPLKSTESLGYHLVEIQAHCCENHVPDSVTCSGWNVEVSNEVFVEKLVIGIASNSAQKASSAFVQLNGGDVFEYKSQAPHFEKHNGVVFSSSCPWMTVANVKGGSELKPLIFGLNEHGVLQVNGGILCNNCSSFSLYSNSSDLEITHLILATKQDLLYIVDTSDILDGSAVGKYDNFLHHATKKREDETQKYVPLWERSAKVVGVLHGDEASVILQTCRGNLECIYPRKLVLASIVNALIQRRFNNALHMVRRHRIDFNILVDYCGWKSFISFAPDFVRQVNNLSHITEFVTAIKNDNTSEKLYKNYIAFPSIYDIKDANVGDSNKVSSILSAIRTALEEHIPESPLRELCILTTLARSDPPALEEALMRVKTTREIELSCSNNKRASYPSAEEALKHLLWLSDPEAVFEAALGLYDLNLAAIVALNAQRDPKEFVPFLQDIGQLPNLVMQYRIDLHLRRFEKALKHIFSAGETHHEEFMSLLKDQPQLFPLGLELCCNPSKRRDIYEAWGDHLMSEKTYEEAATAFLCCSCLDKSLKAYKAGGYWGGVLTVAGLMNLTKDDVLKLAYDLCEELQALGKPSEAAKIALEYCGDRTSAVNLLVIAREWEEALRIAFMHESDDLTNEVRNASVECGGTLVSEYEEGVEKIGKYLTRFLAVRQRRLLLDAKIKSEERSVNDVDDDLMSETSSNLSGMSAYSIGSRRDSSAASFRSSTSSKARGGSRQRNRGKIRAGSPDEEMALVEHLKGMSMTSGALRELKSLLSTLLMLGKEEIARKLQHIGEIFQISQIAAVKLAEDAISTDIVDENVYSLDRYMKKVKCDYGSQGSVWRSRILISP